LRGGSQRKNEKEVRETSDVQGKKKTDRLHVNQAWGLAGGAKRNGKRAGGVGKPWGSQSEPPGNSPEKIRRKDKRPWSVTRVKNLGGL